MGLFGRAQTDSAGTTSGSSTAGTMVQVSKQADPLADFFVELMEVSGTAPIVIGTITPQRLYDLVVAAIPFLRDSTVRQSDHLAQAQTETFDVAWGVFANGDVSAVLCVPTRYDGDYVPQMTALVVEPLKAVGAAHALHVSTASRGKVEPEVAQALNGARAVFIDHLRSNHTSSSADASAHNVDDSPKLLEHSNSQAENPVVPATRASPAVSGPTRRQPGSASSGLLLAGVADVGVNVSSAVPGAATAPRDDLDRAHQLVKGANVVLDGPRGVDPERVLVELHADRTVRDVRLHRIAVAVGADDRVVSDKHFLGFAATSTPDGALGFEVTESANIQRDCATRLRIDLGRVPGQVSRILIGALIDNAAQHRQTFREINRAELRVSAPDGRSLVRSCIDRPGDTETLIVFGELYRHGGRWKVRAVWQGYQDGLDGIAADYGVRI